MRAKKAFINPFKSIFTIKQAFFLLCFSFLVILKQFSGKYSFGEKMIYSISFFAFPQKAKLFGTRKPAGLLGRAKNLGKTVCLVKK